MRHHDLLMALRVVGILVWIVYSVAMIRRIRAGQAKGVQLYLFVIAEIIWAVGLGLSLLA